MLISHGRSYVPSVLVTMVVLFSGLLGYLHRQGIGSLDAAQAASSSTIQLGVFTDGAPSSMAKVDAFSSLVGTPPKILMWYQVWGNPDDSPFYASIMNQVVQRGMMPMITWEPWSGIGAVTDPSYSLASIINGSHDAYIRQFAHDAAAWGQPFYLRFAHEMNGNWTTWGQGVNGNTPDQYIAAWRHVHDLFVQTGATNARWVWSPNVDNGTQPFTPLYPGDAYVDWVALDGYNAASVWNSPWLSLAQVFGPSYDSLAALTSKPMMIAETASTETGGDKASWITAGFLTDLPTRLPRIKAVIWYNTIQDTDWRINSSPAALAAFQLVAQNPRFGGSGKAKISSGSSTSAQSSSNSAHLLSADQAAQPSPQLSGCTYFSATQHNICGGFQTYWQDFGGLAVFGMPLTSEFQQNGVTTQYFERARFEWHPGTDPQRFDVLLGLLGREVTAGRGGDPPFQPTATNSSRDCTFFPATGHSLCGGFRAYWVQYGGLADYGYPISEAFQEKNPDTGVVYTVQYFERARFEWHPGQWPERYDVELGRLGAQVLAAGSTAGH